jgi:tetratricopeptide (TPR) repeat protein
MINLNKLNNLEEAANYFTLGKKEFKANLGKVYGKAFELVVEPADVPDIYYHIFHARAICNLQLKNYKEALTDCNWAIFLRPLEGESFLFRAEAKIRLKDYREVCSDLDKAMQLGVVQAAAARKKYCR